jgi:hypothetical protein
VLDGDTHSPFAESILNYLEAQRGQAFKVSNIEEFIEDDFKRKKIDQEPLFAPLSLSDHKHGDFWLRPKFDVLNELNRLLDAANLERLPQFIDEHYEELRKRRKLKFAREHHEALSWQQARQLADAPALLQYLDQFLHTKNEHPEEAVKLLRVWFEEQQDSWQEAGEDSAHWEHQYKTAKKALEKAKKDAALVPGLKKEVKALQAQVKKLKAEIKTLEAQHLEKQAAPEPKPPEKLTSLQSILFNSENSSWKPFGTQKASPEIPIPELVDVPARLLRLAGGGMVFSSGYSMGKYPVTQREWEAVMGTNPSYTTGGNLPVVNVSWHDCQEYIKKLNAATGANFRLPYEVEWESAAGYSATKQLRWAGTNEENQLGDYAWYAPNSGDTLQPVGAKKPNPSGLYDMSGNIWEWCQDWHGDYPTTFKFKHTGPETGEHKIVRGGSYNSKADQLLVGTRNHVLPESIHSDLGFRLCMDKPEEQKEE